MQSLLFALQAVAPIVGMIALGYVLKKLKFLDSEMAKRINRLVFRLFLPVMLFLNVYKITDIGQIDLSYVGYTVWMLLGIFAVSVPVVMGLEKEASRRGVLLQSGFRSNYALIGIPLAEALFGAQGVSVATVLSAVVVPLLNVLGVIALSLFRQDGTRPSIQKILTDIIKNPLILGVFCGLCVLGLRALAVRFGIAFRLTDLPPVYTVLQWLSNLATPLALLMLGAQFEFSRVASLRRQIAFGTLMRTVIVPVLGIGVACLIGRFEGAHFAAFVAVFATPVSVSSVPMAQEMGGDATLAGQLVVWTTLLSAVSVFVISCLLRLVGIF